MTKCAVCFRFGLGWGLVRQVNKLGSQIGTGPEAFYIKSLDFGWKDIGDTQASGQR